LGELNTGPLSRALLCGVQGTFELLFLPYPPTNFDPLFAAEVSCSGHRIFVGFGRMRSPQRPPIRQRSPTLLSGAFACGMIAFFLWPLLRGSSETFLLESFPLPLFFFFLRLSWTGERSSQMGCPPSSIDIDVSFFFRPARSPPLDAPVVVYLFFALPLLLSLLFNRPGLFRWSGRCLFFQPAPPFFPLFFDIRV